MSDENFGRSDVMLDQVFEIISNSGIETTYNKISIVSVSRFSVGSSLSKQVFVHQFLKPSLSTDLQLSKVTTN